MVCVCYKKGQENCKGESEKDKSLGENTMYVYVYSVYTYIYIYMKLKKHKQNEQVGIHICMSILKSTALAALARVHSGAAQINMLMHIILVASPGPLEIQSVRFSWKRT